MGGLIHAHGTTGYQPEIWTISAGIPPVFELSPCAKSLHQLWGTPSPSDTLRVRLEEDDHAIRILGVTRLHFDFLDCIYRRNPNGAWLYTDIYPTPHLEDGELLREITASITSLLSSEDRMYCPLAIGAHVDHRIVRAAIENLGKDIYYYADIPYVLKEPTQLTNQTTGMTFEVNRLSEEDFALWIISLSAYQSQLSTLYESFDSLVNAIRKYREKWGGVPIWKEA